MKGKVGRKTSEHRHQAGAGGFNASLTVRRQQHQQKVVNIFRDAFWSSSDVLDVVQQVKGHLYNRDFAAAFSKPEYLQAYALRWSCSRALCYADLLDTVQKHLSHPHDATQSEQPFRSVCIGGGAGAELVGLAAWLSGPGKEYEHQLPTNCHPPSHVQLVDIADWSGVSQQLFLGISEPPKLSRYATSAAKDNNLALLAADDRISYKFVRSDVLEPEAKDAWIAAVESADLVTIMFTLNELYSSSMPKTQEFLAALTNAARPGTCLLVVDSPGSYSTVTLNGGEKRYPMHWLLDYTLLGPSSAPKRPSRWAKLINEESRWFRIPDGLQYPIELENMRYQVHLYRRLAEVTAVD